MAVKSASNALLQIEAGQTNVAMVALTEGTDLMTYSSAASLWSAASGKEPSIIPNGLVSGGVITPDTTNNKVLISNLTAYIAGSLVTLTSIASQTISRGSSNGYRISSITITSGGAIAIVAGTESTAFSETRGAAGGPPWIPTGSIEIGQIRFTSITAALVQTSEIKQIVGVHQEHYAFPVFNEAYARSGGYAGVTFIAANAKIHSDDSGTTSFGRKVYAQYYTPDFMTLDKVSGFVPPETAFSLSSTPIYGGAVGASSSSLNAGSFTAYLNDGIADSIIALKGSNLWFKFFPDRAATTKYLLCQGKLGITRSFPADNAIQAACTITGSDAALEVKP